MSEDVPNGGQDDSRKRARPGGHPGGGTDPFPPGHSERFERAYAGGRPPWDIGHAQAAIVKAFEDGWISGRILDVGCGTGENSLFLASRGLTVLGMDASPTAIEAARAKAEQRAAAAVFFVADIVGDVPAMYSEETFDTVVDIGFFHALDDEQRAAWIERLAGLLAVGGSYVMLCFSDRVPGVWGPRRVSEEELIKTFTPATGFTDLQVVGSRLEATVGANGVDAWLVRAERGVA